MVILIGLILAAIAVVVAAAPFFQILAVWEDEREH